jgi:hypothetical protein
MIFIGLKYQGEIPLVCHKNEGQEGKIGLFWRWVPVKGGKERVDVGVYGRCILYPHMKTEE